MAALVTYGVNPQAVDVAVIGAGVNGLAIVRELARRGFTVAVLDRGDIASQTSAISTRLIHGGLKYLERLEINVVYESVRERNILLRRAPHLVRPYPMLIPFAKKSRRPGWFLSCGLFLYDLLSLGKPLPISRILFEKRMRSEYPSVAEGGAKWGGVFTDAQVPRTERLCVELAMDAQAHGASILTYSRVEKILSENGRIVGLEYRDRMDDSMQTLRAKLVVNVAGPWVDDILDLTGSHERHIGPTKGSHLVVDGFPGAPKTCIFFESPDDGRPMFILPWLGRYMIGTTDLPYDGSLEHVVMDDHETDYLLRAVNALIPAAQLNAEDVLWSYSGVRPLPFVGEVKDASKVSRDHEIVVHDDKRRGMVTVIGGKLTTHRALGELVALRIGQELKRPSGRSPTRNADLPGAPSLPLDEFIATFTAKSTLGTRVARRLAEVYGARAGVVEACAVRRPSLAAVVDEDTGAIAAEAVHAVEDEGAHSLEDIVLRRMTVGLNRDVGLTAAPVIAQVLVDHGIWSRERADEEVVLYRIAMQRFNPKASRVETKRGVA